MTLIKICSKDGCNQPIAKGHTYCKEHKIEAQKLSNDNYKGLYLYVNVIKTNLEPVYGGYSTDIKGRNGNHFNNRDNTTFGEEVLKHGANMNDYDMYIIDLSKTGLNEKEVLILERDMLNRCSEKLWNKEDKEPLTKQEQEELELIHNKINVDNLELLPYDRWVKGRKQEVKNRKMNNKKVHTFLGDIGLMENDLRIS